MRYYLDTNILAFLVTEQEDEICADVKAELSDYANQFLASSVCVMELMHLLQTGKLPPRKGHPAPSAASILPWLDETGIKVVPSDKHHLQALSGLPLYDDHRDPNDRLVIAQAIADRTPLISSDRKFGRYAGHGLDLLFNDR